jgi:hypothetical protein
MRPKNGARHHATLGHPIRNHWDMRHESKKSYKRNSNQQEEIEDIEEENEDQGNSNKSSNIAEGNNTSIST